MLNFVESCDDFSAQKECTMTEARDPDVLLPLSEAGGKSRSRGLIRYWGLPEEPLNLLPNSALGSMNIKDYYWVTK